MKMNIADERKTRLIDELSTFLLSEPPIPVYTIRLLYQFLNCWSDDLKEIFPKSGILEVLITLIEMQNTEQKNFSLQKQLLPLLREIWDKMTFESIHVLLENDFIEVTF